MEEEKMEFDEVHPNTMCLFTVCDTQLLVFTFNAMVV